MSESLLINHCSPTLAGVKTGNIFSCDCHCKKELNRQIRHLNRLLVPKGLRILPLKVHNGKALIYVYRPVKLAGDLNDNMATNLLKQCGYDLKNSNYCVAHLVKRLEYCSDFPHEIGLFLGYPPEDVDGFINQKPHNCKYTGIWKVYGDVEKAKKTFAAYKKCSEIYSRRWQDGYSLEQLAVCV